uniref:Uncharacterized protein n=1 Tax=Magnetococcus massalia (strain MO-1) TaxID=451514 RepID=A0A1S7LHF4_MAGMO|nr:membrane protein of unknown function [Candidatus Magnetococcus massalia]
MLKKCQNPEYIPYQLVNVEGFVYSKTNPLPSDARFSKEDIRLWFGLLFWLTATLYVDLNAEKRLFYSGLFFCFSLGLINLYFYWTNRVLCWFFPRYGLFYLPYDPMHTELTKTREGALLGLSLVPFFMGILFLIYHVTPKNAELYGAL